MLLGIYFGGDNVKHTNLRPKTIEYLKSMDYIQIVQRIEHLESKENRDIDEDIELYRLIIKLNIFNYKLMLLDEDERECLFYRYLNKEKYSLRSIGNILGFSKNKVSRLINSAIDKLAYYSFELGDKDAKY